jgi:hypothetical protein
MEQMTLPFDLTLHHIRLTCDCLTPIHFGVHGGAQWRGALWDALRAFACTDPKQQRSPAHSWYCPMCFVLALEAESPRGVNPARPLIIRPPLSIRAEEDCTFSIGERFTLELVLVGEAWRVFPYLLQAVQRIGQKGIGFGRGRFSLHCVEALNPLNGSSSLLYEAGGKVRMPDIPVTGLQVMEQAAQLPADRMRLHFLTPTQLVCDGKLLSRPQPDVLIMRTLERLQALQYHYGEPISQEMWKSWHETLSRAAVHIRRDETRWIRAYSGSRRANRMQDVSGFVGSVILEGDLAPVRLWLLWASLVNVGKNAIKGNGWFEVSN